MTEKECTKIARKEIGESFIKKTYMYFTGEIADCDLSRPDNVFAQLDDSRRIADESNISIHTIESKVERRDLVSKGVEYCKAVEQAISCYGNYHWLAIPKGIELNEDEFRNLVIECNDVGVGLIFCQKTRADILIKSSYDNNICLYEYSRWKQIIEALEKVRKG